jgi:hypothetical protein
MSNKRNAEEMGADVEDTTDRKRKCVGIENLVFLFFTAALCGGLCQGCDLCHPEACEPEKANAIRKDGIIYKQIGRDFKRAFASLTCLFIRMYKSFKGYTTPTARLYNRGRLVVDIRDDNGVKMKSQALKFACLAWGQLTPAAKLGTAGMPLRDFGSAHPVDHTGNNKTINIVSKGMIMTLPEHHAKTKQSAETIATAAMSKSAPCTMTVFDLEGKPLLDSEGKPIVKNEPHRKKLMIKYKLTSNKIANSIRDNDSPTRNSLVKIKYKGQDCLAQFSWYNVPDLVGEIWKPVTETDHKTMGAKMSETYEYFVSNMSRFKFVTKSTQNARIRDFRGHERPSILLMKSNLFFHRVVALVFHRKQMDKYIAEQFLNTGIVWTFVKGDYQLEVDHIDFNPENHYANNLQFLTPEENKQRSNSRPCIIWEIGKKDAQKEHPSVAAAANKMGYGSANSVHTILKNNTHKKWRGEYIVKIG